MRYHICIIANLSSYGMVSIRQETVLTILGKLISKHDLGEQQVFTFLETCMHNTKEQQQDLLMMCSGID